VKSAFLATIGGLALAYTILAFRLDFLSPDGTLGPGFLPRALGIALLAILIPDALARFQDTGPGPVSGPDSAMDGPTHGTTALVVVGLSVAFVVLIPILGTVPAAALFVLATLVVVNPGSPGKNLVLSLALAALVFLIFQVWLDVQLPAGLLGRFA
jgi:hypothetical protein